jgi:hypothetical protein
VTTPIDPRDDPMSLGRILLDSGVISPWQLAAGVSSALAKDTRLGEALVELGHTTPADIDWAIDIQGASRALNREEKTRRTVGLVVSATAQIATLADSIADATRRADDIIRRLRMRRTTVKL